MCHLICIECDVILCNTYKLFTRLPKSISNIRIEAFVFVSLFFSILVARMQVHSEICALLIDVLKSLSKCLTDFNSISSKQWTFVDAKTDNNDLFKRLTQIIALSNVCIPFE